MMSCSILNTPRAYVKLWLPLIALAASFEFVRWGGGGAGPPFSPAPFLLGGGWGSKRSAPLFPGPQGEPAHGLHPRFVLAEIWAD